jgi:RND family efflux transporter MFP subunit
VERKRGSLKGFRMFGTFGRSGASFAAVALNAFLVLASPWAGAQGIATAEVRASGDSLPTSFNGVVEAVQQTAVASQVAGAVIAVEVRAGDRVSAGQVLVRIDAQAALQSLAASEAEARSARAELEVAAKDLDRQRQLFERNYTSRAALDRAEGQFSATEARLSALVAQAGAVRAQSGHFVIKAPYASVVADVPAMQGDMALPGRTLLTLYDPRAMRVTVSVPESMGAVARSASGIKAEIPGLGGRASIEPTRVEVLPTADPGTHTVQLRLGLPPGTDGARPGMFARVWLPQAATPVQRLSIPASSVVRRAEMTGVYVVDDRGRPMLRQVRLGRPHDGDVEVLAGVSAGERVAVDPQLAARHTATR